MVRKSHLINVYWSSVSEAEVLIAFPTPKILPAYRAILAEPRSKSNTSEDYSGGGSRGEYSGDSSNQYGFHAGLLQFKAQAGFRVLFLIGVRLCSRSRELCAPRQPCGGLHALADGVHAGSALAGADLRSVRPHSRHGVLRAAERLVRDEQR